MALFDLIIGRVAEKFGLGNSAGTLLSSVLSLMTNRETGGFSGFISRFKDAGLEDTVSSWIAEGDNSDISDDQVTSVLGSDSIKNIADQAGISTDQTTSAIGFILPQVVNKLTPDGKVPDTETLLLKVGGFLTGIGETAAGAVSSAGATTSGAVDSAGDVAKAVGDSAGATLDKGKEVAGDAVGAVGDAANTVTGKVGEALENVEETFDVNGGGPILKWMLPLLLFILLLMLAFWFFNG